MYPPDPRNSTSDVAYILVTMRSTRKRAALEAWTGLQSKLGGSFTAHRRGVRGLITGELTLSYGDGRKLGWLKPDGLEGARLEVGGLAADIQCSPDAGRSYKMSSAATELLGTTNLLGDRPNSALPELSGAGETYGMRVNLLRNSAAVWLGGREVTSLEGNFVGLHYKVTLPDGETPLVLPAALFLLYYVPALRSRAYRAGPGPA